MSTKICKPKRDGLGVIWCLFKTNGQFVNYFDFSLLFKTKNKRISKNSDFFPFSQNDFQRICHTFSIYTIYQIQMEYNRKKNEIRRLSKSPKLETCTTNLCVFFSLSSSLFCWIGFYYRAPLPPPHTNVRENLTRTVSEIFFCLWRKGKTIKNKQPAMESETWAKWMGKYIMMYMCI